LGKLITQTDASGQFKFGPIDSSLDFTITAEKESYVFSEYDSVTNTFTGYKLCEIVVSVKDEQGNKLSGVSFLNEIENIFSFYILTLFSGSLVIVWWKLSQKLGHR
jgi:hypothetical protein